ncbi:MAG: hypothetical protein ACK51L_04210, partial [bacterium]
MTSSQETKITAEFSYIKNVGKHILFNFNYDLLGYKRLLDNPADFAWFTDVFHSYCPKKKNPVVHSSGHLLGSVR